MKNKEALLSELANRKELLDIIVNNRKKKILVRWILGVIFYYLFWQIGWVYYLFWVGLLLELILFLITLISLFLLRTNIQSIQKELREV